MLAEIETATIAYLAAKVPDIRHVDSMASVLTEKMAYSLAILEGAAEPATHQEDTRQHVELKLWLAFKNLKSDEDRRKGAFPLLEGIAQKLLKQKLGLGIKRISYHGFKDITDSQDRGAGQVIYELGFKTSYVITMLDEEGADELLKVGLNYLLNGSPAAAAQDVVVLEHAAE